MHNNTILAAAMFAVIAAPGSAYADEGEQDNHEEEVAGSPTDHSHDHRFALGVSAGPVYLLAEQELTFGVHGHFIAAIAKSPFGIGLGYERLLDEHQHNALSIVFQYRILDPWSVSLSPGIAFEGSDLNAIEPAVHLETAYEFELGPIDLGPAFEVAWEPEGVHLTLAVHAGVHF